MIDADAVVFRPCAGLIIPEGIKSCFIRRRPRGIGEAQILQLAEGCAGLWQEQCVAFPHAWVVAIEGLGNDVVVARQNERFLEREAIFGKTPQPLHPGKLVGIFDRIVRRIAVRQIERADADRAAFHGKHAFDETRLFIGIVTRQAAIDLVGLYLREQRDAIEALLAVSLDVIAERFQLKPGKTLIDRFDFLKADDVRR